jgi:CubicO group peptidase (beta-lactamase class C family)
MENETGKTYEELLREYIWLPFRMTNTYVTGKVKYENRAVGYFTKQPAEYWEFDCLAGAGAIKSTTTNMLNYLEGNIQTRNRDIAKAIERITVPTYPISPDVSIASGWHTFENLRYRTFWHNGGTYGFSTFCAFEPKTKSAVIIACNSFNVNSQVDKLGTDIMILLTGK